MKIGETAHGRMTTQCSDSRTMTVDGSGGRQDLGTRDDSASLLRVLPNRANLFGWLISSQEFLF